MTTPTTKELILQILNEVEEPLSTHDLKIDLESEDRNVCYETVRKALYDLYIYGKVSRNLDKMGQTFLYRLSNETQEHQTVYY